MKQNKHLTNGLKSLKDHFRADIVSGFTVALIALPLCLGIAMASGFPPVAGIFTAIIGGMLASRIAGSHVTIYGPAAGLIVVNLSAIETLGAGDAVAGYHYALAAIVAAGVLITLFGFLKVGKLGDFFPTAAVHGMLAAIGIIIMVKQFFIAVGTKSAGHELPEVIADIPGGLMRVNPYIGIIAIVSLVVLIIHPLIKARYIKMIPAPMWVLIFAIPMTHVFDLTNAHAYQFGGKVFEAGPSFLINLPANVTDGLAFPDFGKAGTGAFWIIVITIALITSLESMLSAAAVDTIDPQKRKSDLNKDLRAVGAGSTLAALIGGLPMISEIVRSRANVDNGARTQWSNFFHGSFLLLFLLLGKPLLDQIPLAALAAMLIFTGFRLASPKEFIKIYKSGKSQFVVFVATIIAVLATDLLIGIGIGIALELVLLYFNGVPIRRTFSTRTEITHDGESVAIKVHDAAIFSNYLSLRKKILSNGDKKKVTIDFREASVIDHTVDEKLKELCREFAANGKHLEILHASDADPSTDRAGFTQEWNSDTNRNTL